MINLTNVTLHTKDGRKMGNAIVTGNDEVRYFIKSDYGNEAALSPDELNELYYIGTLTDETHKHFTH